jgi:hypothetical protein
VAHAQPRRESSECQACVILNDPQLAAKKRKIIGPAAVKFPRAYRRLAGFIRGTVLRLFAANNSGRAAPLKNKMLHFGAHVFT